MVDKALPHLLEAAYLCGHATEQFVDGAENENAAKDDLERIYDRNVVWLSVTALILFLTKLLMH